MLSTPPRQTNFAEGAGITSLGCTYGASPLSGSLLVCALGYNRNSAPSSVTVSNGSDVIGTGIAFGGNTSTDVMFALYHVLVSGGGSTYTWSVTVPTSGALKVYVAEYPGGATFDQASGISTGGGTAASSTSLTPAQPNELGIALVTVGYATGMVISTWGNGFVLEIGPSSNQPLGLADVITSGAIGAAATLPASGQWAAALALYAPLSTGQAEQGRGYMASPSAAAPC